MSSLVLTRSAGEASRPGALARRLAKRAVNLVWLMVARSRERQVLASLDRRMLRDVGLTPYEAGKESGKWFWAP